MSKISRSKKSKKGLRKSKDASPCPKFIFQTLFQKGPLFTTAYHTLTRFVPNLDHCPFEDYNTQTKTIKIFKKAREDKIKYFPIQISTLCLLLLKSPLPNHFPIDIPTTF